MSLSRTVFRYQPDTQRDEPVIMALTVAAERYPRYGFKKLFQVLRRQGKSWNHKRVHRIYCLLKLNFRRKGKQRLWIGPYVSIHFLSLNPLLVRRRRYSRGERYPSALCGCHSL